MGGMEVNSYYFSMVYILQYQKRTRGKGKCCLLLYSDKIVAWLRSCWTHVICINPEYRMNTDLVYHSRKHMSRDNLVPTMYPRPSAGSYSSNSASRGENKQPRKNDWRKKEEFCILRSRQTIWKSSPFSDHYRNNRPETSKTTKKKGLRLTAARRL